MATDQNWRMSDAYWLDVYAAAQRMVRLTTEPTPESDALCDWEHGMSLCPGCTGVVRLVPRLSQMPRVVDGDGREHRCQRSIAAVLQRHGVGGMEPILTRHGERPVVDAPTTAPQQAPVPWERWVD